MTDAPPQGKPPAIVSNTGLALIVYVLYLAGYITGITKIIGVIIAHVQVDTPDPVVRSHHQFQIRTFWVGLLYIVVGVLTSFVVIGVFILLWWLIWSLIRNIKGVLLLNENRPIANPQSWMFG